jgi:two-component system, OmpR family, phosphate regulon response regulator PhoB
VVGEGSPTRSDRELIPIRGPDPRSLSDVILVVDDDLDLVDVVRTALEREGFAVDDAGDGETALIKISGDTPELVVLDLGLPKVRGLDVLRQVRVDNAVPVIVLSGCSEEADRIVGLELGADDYVVKPFSPRELVARVRSVLRRSRAPRRHGRLEFGDLDLDFTTREVWSRGEPVDLRRREFDLLAFLCASPRQVFTRDQLLRHVWDSEPEWQGVGTVSEHVHRLRAKVEVDPARPCHIVTVRGVGYRFVP